MMDFSSMEYGVIKDKKGTIIVIKGTFFGPFNNHELGKLVLLMKEDDK